LVETTVPVIINAMAQPRNPDMKASILTSMPTERRKKGMKMALPVNSSRL